MNTIVPTQAIPSVGRIDTQPGRQAQAIPLPEPGQLLKALVLEAQTDNRFLLQIGDNRLVARSQVALQPGQTLQLQLVSTSPQIQLRIVNDALQQLLGRSLTLIGNNVDIGSLFTLLQQPQTLLDSLSVSSRQALESFFALQQTPLAAGNGGDTLKQLVDRLGLAFENHLARGDGDKAASTLKAALLEVLSSFTSDSRIHDSAAKPLATLEFFQLAQLHSPSSQQFILPLPLSFIEQGFLLVEQRQDEGEGGGKGKYGEQEYRFSLHLKMSDIGNLRIDFLHSPEGLLIRFHADSQEKADFIASFSDDLKRAISEAPLLGISFAADAVDPVAELIRRIVPEGRSVLDTTA